MANKFYHANLHTTNFNFDAYGATEKKAISALKRGFRKHAEHYDIPKDWWKEYGDSFRVAEVSLGSCVRDNWDVITE